MNIIVAASKNMGIGFKNKLPWNLKKELGYFKRKTVGNGNNLIVMGKNTWMGLPIKPLPFRYNCVLSTTLKTNLKDTKIVSNKNELEKFICSNHFSKVWIIGGESVYKDFINEPYVENIYLTHIDKYYDCDTFFPNIPDHFYLKRQSETKEENNISYNYKLFSRKNIEYNANFAESDEKVANLF